MKIKENNGKNFPLLLLLSALCVCIGIFVFVGDIAVLMDYNEDKDILPVNRGNIFPNINHRVLLFVFPLKRYLDIFTQLKC